MSNNLRRRAAKTYRQLTSGIRRLPDFIIIGVAKGGTTSLFQYLATHPQIAFSTAKETDYFYKHFDKGLSWYKSYFPLQQWLTNSHTLVGEATPDYFCRSRTVPKRIENLLPDAKLIVLLRNPIDRAYSHYAHRRRKGAEKESDFAKVAIAEMQQLTEKLAAFNQDNSHKPSIACYHLATGLYIIHLQSWLEHFPPEQLLILQSEDLFSQPNQIVNQVTNFLDLPQISKQQFPIFNQGNYQEIDLALREELRNFFAPYNRQLYEFVQRDFGWQ
ncbi:MAG: sulfotransferase domain-containing protein [Oscillatoria sp. PMC 1068.18]|nr:sulfotransferase domain-containing protein [Oscillatoria sp. PMC 1076.18]MEC4987701.1 sulfotransferase domain-containing protein [Oscillatoria sp. PMC 1068.18]